MIRERVWKIRSPSPEVERLSDEMGLPPFLARLLINRGISDIHSAGSFLTPRLSDLADPMLLKDMDAALKLIINAIENQERITVFGDYDVDGITATALLLNLFAKLGVSAFFYVPNRFREGYGLNPEAIEKISKVGPGLIITVDCGISSRKEIELALQRGMKMVITDHHRVPEGFDPLCPVINPHRAGSAFPFKYLSGVGVAFYLAVALRAALREKGWFRDHPEPDLKQSLDLVALGTVADRVPLLDQNRILVRSGIEIIKTSPCLGIRALQDVAGIIPSSVSASALAFKLAPCLNAAGRMSSADSGIHLLTTDEPSVACSLAGKLNSLNSRRQSVEQDILREIEKEISTMEDPGKRRTLVFAGKGWHRGVLGIVASRLVDRFHRPTLVLGITDGKATGSGRSIDGFNLYEALAGLGDLIERFGGHDHAVGLTLEAGHVQGLREVLEDLAGKMIGVEELVPVIEADGEIALQDLTSETMHQMMRLSPFGFRNPEPLFYIRSLQVVESRVVGERHLRLKVKQGTRVMEAIGFGLSDRHSLEGSIIHMICVPEINEWNGYQRVQLRIMDLEDMDRDLKRIKLEAC